MHLLEVCTSCSPLSWYAFYGGEVCGYWGQSMRFLESKYADFAGA